MSARELTATARGLVAVPAAVPGVAFCRAAKPVSWPRPV